MKEKKRFYQRKWFLWLWLVFVPPIGIILLWTLHKTMKKSVKVILTFIFTFWFIILVSVNDNTSNTQTDMIVTETSQSQIEQDEEEQEKDAYGWSTKDYEEFSVALKMIADKYLTEYKLPSYDKWQFAKFDDDGRIFAMTKELTFKDNHEKHTLICVFSLIGEVGENGIHEKVNYSFFGTDEKVYYDDGTCNEVFEKLEKSAQK